MGLSSSQQKTRTAETSTATTTPTTPSWLSSPWQQFTGAVSGLNPAQAQPISSTANQNAAFARAGSLQTQPGLLNFTPTQVQAGQLASTDISPYTDPYEDEVVSRSLADLERMRAGAVAEGQGRATMSGAYGGSRHGIADAETNRGFLDQAGLLSSSLRSAGFRNAQDRAVGDIDRRYSADTFNSGQDLAGAGVRLAAGADERANIGLMSDLGTQERAIAQENDPYMQRVRALMMQAGLLGAVPSNLFVGQNVNASGTSNSTTTSTPSGLDTIGRILAIAQSAAGKPG